MQPSNLRLVFFRPHHTLRKVVLAEMLRGGRTTYRQLTTGLWKRGKRKKREEEGVEKTKNVMSNGKGRKQGE